MNTTTSHVLRIATRASALALWQAHHVSDLLRQGFSHLVVEIVEISTTGDRVLSQPLRDFGGLGVFTREVQLAVLDGRADLAVHSLKDLPTEAHPDLVLAAIPQRGLTADALVLPAHVKPGVEDLPIPHGARVATGSPRRQAQLRFHRPDLQLLEVRGNVQTRLSKLDAGEFDAMILACAGLDRLGLHDRIARSLTAPFMYHAVGQGALGIECRQQDEATRTILESLNHHETRAAALAERTLLTKLRAGCHAPVGVITEITVDTLRLEAVVLTLDGRTRWMAAAAGSIQQPESIGQTVADLLIQQGAMLQA